MGCFWRGHDYHRQRGHLETFCLRCGKQAPMYADLLGVTRWLVQGERQQDAKKHALKDNLAMEIFMHTPGTVLGDVKKRQNDCLNRAGAKGNGRRES